MRHTIVVLFMCVLAAILIGGCAQTPPVVANHTLAPLTMPLAQSDTIKVIDSSLGTILTYAKGMTLH